jgi:hypothetical protein
VFSLTESLDLDQSLVFYMIVLLDDDYWVKVAFWHELISKIQKYYETVIDFFQIWCMFNDETSWSAILKNLKKWAVNRMHESTLTKQEKNKMITIQSYLFDIRSYHVDYLYNLNVFDHSRLQKMLRKEKRMFLVTKATRLLIIKNILQLITQNFISFIDNINFDIAFKIAWARFLRLSEIIYISKKISKITFSKIKTTRSNISFAKDNQYVILRFKRSKTDVDHSEVQIMIIAINESICSILVLRQIFHTNSQLMNASLFRLTGEIFSRIVVIKKLKNRLIKNDIKSNSYFDHSFRKKATQHVSNNDMLDENIQRLRRWTFNAFQLFFKISMKTRLHLNLNFQKNRSLIILRITQLMKQSVDQSDKSIDQSITHSSLSTSLSD